MRSGLIAARRPVAVDRRVRGVPAQLLRQRPGELRAGGHRPRDDHRGAAQLLRGQPEARLRGAAAVEVGRFTREGSSGGSQDAPDDPAGRHRCPRAPVRTCGAGQAVRRGRPRAMTARVASARASQRSRRSAASDRHDDALAASRTWTTSASTTRNPTHTITNAITVVTFSAYGEADLPVRRRNSRCASGSTLSAEIDRHHSGPERESHRDVPRHRQPAPPASPGRRGGERRGGWCRAHEVDAVDLLARVGDRADAHGGPPARRRGCDVRQQGTRSRGSGPGTSRRSSWVLAPPGPARKLLTTEAPAGPGRRGSCPPRRAAIAYRGRPPEPQQM